MKVCIDIENFRVIRSFQYPERVTNRIEVKRGDTREFDFQFGLPFGASVDINPSPILLAMRFGAKPLGGYSGDYIVFTDTVAKVVNGTEINYHMELDLDTEPVADALKNEDDTDKLFVDLIAEVKWSLDGIPKRTLTFILRVHNSVNNGTEGLPSPGGPVYYTAGEVDTLVEGALEAEATARANADTALQTTKANLAGPNTFTSGPHSFSGAVVQMPIVAVADDTARFVLTTEQLRNGMIVSVTATERQYVVVDQTQLDDDAGYSLLNPGGPVVIQFRQGTDSDRQSITPAEGEPLYTTDKKMLWVGDGSTIGGLNVGRDIHFTGSGDVNVQHFRVRNSSLSAGAGVDVVDLSHSTFQFKKSDNGQLSIDVNNRTLWGTSGFVLYDWRNCLMYSKADGSLMVEFGENGALYNFGTVSLNWVTKTLYSSWKGTGGIGMYNVTPPASQPTTPTDLAGVIALLQSYGMCS